MSWVRGPGKLFVRGEGPILDAGCSLHVPDPPQPELLAWGKDYVRHSDGLWVPPARGGYFVPPVWLVASTFTFTLPTFHAKGPKPDRVDTTRTEPFVGWKTLSVMVTKKGKLRLVGYGNRKYGIDATAVCNYQSDHVAPVWECSCGFYALTEKPTTPELGWFMAEVELFGTVIAGEHGWRASRQRVLSMEVFRSCQANGGECGDPADGFQVGRSGGVWPTCARHAPLGYASLADLTARLGTEVRWAS